MAGKVIDLPVQSKLCKTDTNLQEIANKGTFVIGARVLNAKR